MNDSLTQKLAFAADCAAKIGTLAAAPTPQARELSAELLIDLRAWRLSEIVPEMKQMRAELFRELANQKQKSAEGKDVDKAREAELAKYRAMWAELHVRALGFDHAQFHDIEMERAWLDSFFEKLPCPACKAAARTHLKELPPDFEDYFHWSVEFHNFVNRSLGKPTVSLRDARELWRFHAVPV